MEDIVPLVKVIAERATVPVALNLDHGGKLEDEIRAMQAGFTNVMIDASSLPYEENVARTKTIVALAHGMGEPLRVRGIAIGEEGRAGEPRRSVYDDAVAIGGVREVLVDGVAALGKREEPPHVTLRRRGCAMAAGDRGRSLSRTVRR